MGWGYVAIFSKHLTTSPQNSLPNLTTPQNEKGSDPGKNAAFARKSHQ